MRDLGENLVQVPAFQDTVCDPLEHFDGFELVGVAVPAFARPKRQMEYFTEALELPERNLGLLFDVDGDRDARSADRRDDNGT